MDFATIGAAVAVVRSIPGTAVADAIEAAQSASSSADRAETAAQSVTPSDSDDLAYILGS